MKDILQTIWFQTTADPKDAAEAMYLMAKIELKSPLDEEKMSGWSKLLEAVKQGHEGARNYVIELCAEASKNKTSPIPDNKFTSEAFVQGHRVDLNRVRSKLWVIAANNEPDTPKAKAC